MNVEKVTRVEIINHAHGKGRVYSIQNDDAPSRCSSTSDRLRSALEAPASSAG